MKKIADYSTTIIYKITCNDSTITEKYVGHTTDVVRRRQEHKNNACNENSSYFNLKLYKFIRDNGGWDNWKMEIVAGYNCNNIYEARQREQEHYVELQASLNSMEPSKPKQPKNEAAIYNCEASFNKITFECEKCNYKCCSKRDFAKHLITRKHKKDSANNSTLQTTGKTFDCKDCGNSYKYQSGLCKHVKNCKCKIQPQSSNDVTALTNLVMELMKNNNKLHQELHKQSNDFQNNILELYKNGSTTVTNNAEKHENIIRLEEGEPRLQ